MSCVSSDPSVSIPFKRESLSKVIIQVHRLRYLARFQFPSNGKAYPKFKQIQKAQGNLDAFEFQFPSNGKAYPKTSSRLRTRSASKFPFPSNGKAYPKNKRITPIWRWHYIVSIPFKRESLSKAECIGVALGCLV